MIFAKKHMRLVLFIDLIHKITKVNYFCNNI